MILHLQKKKKKSITWVNISNHGDGDLHMSENALKQVILLYLTWTVTGGWISPNLQVLTGPWKHTCFASNVTGWPPKRWEKCQHPVKQEVRAMITIGLFNWIFFFLNFFYVFFRSELCQRDQLTPDTWYWNSHSSWYWVMRSRTSTIREVPEWNVSDSRTRLKIDQIRSNNKKKTIQRCVQYKQWCHYPTIGLVCHV